MTARERLELQRWGLRYDLGQIVERRSGDDDDDYFDDGSDEPLRRPPRMWNRTFQKLRKKDWSLQERLDDIFSQELRKKFGPKLRA